MRQDYARLIIDCTRNPGEREIFKDCRRNRLPDEDLPYREPMRMWRTKGFNDRLTPLYGMLRKNCGRYWDDVWSEICAQADSRNVAGWHLREHLRYMVSTKIVRDENGNPLDPSRRRWFMVQNFYVDEDGILCEVLPDRVANRRHHPQLKPGKGVKKINGCWFKGAWKENIFVPVVGGRKTFDFIPEKQLNRKELKRLKLTNDNQE